MCCQEPDLEALAGDLLTFGADLNAVDVEGHSALHFCALFGRWQAAKILVRLAIDVFIFFLCGMLL
jgi:ankyrin repeat protein